MWDLTPLLKAGETLLPNLLQVDMEKTFTEHQKKKHLLKKISLPAPMYLSISV